MSDIYFISDTHFGHTNIIKYCSRPFTDAEEMNITMMENWNNTVKPDDIVFFLGDLCFGGKKDVEYWIKNLNGLKKMILGNHDRFKPREYEDMGFVFASRYPIIFDKFIILSHEPVFLETNSPYCNLYGHLHQNNYGDGIHYYNCCVEHHDYTPVNYEEIKKFFKNVGAKSD